MQLSPMRIGVALFAVFNPVVAFLLAVEWIHWTEEQTGAVALTANTGIALVVAVLAHFKVGTKTETVALQGGTVAFTSSLLGMLVLFEIITLSVTALALVGPIIVAMFGLGGAIIAREAVTAETTPPPG